MRQAVAGGVDLARAARRAARAGSAARAAPGRRPRAAVRPTAVDLDRCVGGTKLPCASDVGLRPAAGCTTRRPLARMVSHVALDRRLRPRRRSPGPTSIASCAGSPTLQLAHRAFEHLEQRGRRPRPARTARAAPSSAGRRCRRPRPARRPPPARPAPTSRPASRSARRSRRSAAPAGRRRRAARPAARCSSRATSVEPVNSTPCTRASATSARAHRLAAAGQQLQRAARHAGRLQHAHRLGGDQRRLLGRLGQHRVAGGQRRGHLAGEDGQREVPRADAHHRAQRPVAWRCRSRAAPAAA